VHELNDQQSAMLVTVMNLSNTDGYVRAFGYQWDQQVFDSAVPVPGGSSGEQLVEPEKLWTYEYKLDGLGVSYWVRINTTSEHLVPSVNFIRSAGTTDPDLSRLYAAVQPGDFALFSLPFRVIPPVPPIGPPIESREP
jgi:hypothetical protein